MDTVKKVEIMDSVKKTKPEIRKKSRKKVGVGQYILTSLLAAYTVFCALPIILVFVSAFTDEKTLVTKGFSYFPAEFSLDGFNVVLRYGKQLIVSYGVTIGITTAGTLLGLLLMSMFAFALSRKDFRLRKILSIYLMIPMIFQGGQLASYIIFTSNYHMKDSIWLLILPLSVTTMNVIILRTYIQTSIPDELMDSARIDGAGEYRAFFQIAFPLMKPACAAVGFMMATTYWNDWQNALLYIDSNSKKPLQLLLINIQKSIETLLNSRNIPSTALAAMQGSIPQYSATMATVITVIGPIMIAYPFFQKYFIKGLTVGSVKG
ncbi:carbohydrate ABC transporter permease [Candidatus Galacturonibacter soehngenii]|uniref:Carbohydrate ABC transporter permease n=1 Tax=Candidatus Galacturonatibacter soehngenii TaxID=2307010 RepID=A0A7V7UGB1_9FIRM|nr:carbohydrate ABC transporter permease [Candidatus Galacturonibacter soehngenii]KAB1438311.1 carbohydrate ABC transporter permease [Candidatus Galacturonibacter soehngenii]MBA4686485.1 carbohydrate ABC transporter permease [Candidatus Galacturonibacter soehngenii]